MNKRKIYRFLENSFSLFS